MLACSLAARRVFFADCEHLWQIKPKAKMWSSLKSDFAELVSVVQEDTTVVLEKMEDQREAQKSSAAIKEAKRRMGLEETFTIPLLQNEHENNEDLGSSSDTASGGVWRWR